MKILIVHEIEWINKVLFEPHHLAELFSLQNHQIYVIDCAMPDTKNIIKGLRTRIVPNCSRIYEDANVTLVRPPSLLVKGLNRLTHFFSCKRVIKKIIEQNNIDVVLLYGAATNGIQTIKIAQQKHIPVIYRLLDISHGLVKIPIARQLAKNFEKKVISNATRVLTTTNDLIHYSIEMGAKKENVEMFPLGINILDFKPMKKSHELKNELGIDKNDKVVVFIGTIYKFAGLDRLINKYHLLNKNTKIIIIGSGSDFNRIKSLVQTKKLEKQIILLGFLPQASIARYIALADICINPFEINYVTNRILPTKILEYLACKKPVLSTPLEGTVELLPDENFGIIYDTQENFVETLSSLLDDEKKLQKLGNNGYAYVLKNHNWNELSKNLIEKFNEVI